jgi:transposase
MTKEQHAEKLRQAARERDRSDIAWKRAILAAHRDGMSYREIAVHAGISHSRVQQIVNDAK